MTNNRVGERGRHKFLWEQYYGARWQYAIKCKFICNLRWLLLAPFFLLENEQPFLGCSNLEENIYIPPMFFESKGVNDFKGGRTSSSNIDIGSVCNRGLIWLANCRHLLQSEMLQIVWDICVRLTKNSLYIIGSQGDFSLSEVAAWNQANSQT